MPSAGEAGCCIGDYALIGDCRTAALVSRGGSIDWLCLPDFSSPSIFAALLDPQHGGACHVRPRDRFRVRRRYVDGTAVLETHFTTDTGSVRLLDLLPVQDGMRPMRPMRELLRVVDGVAGVVDMDVRLDLRPDYARCRVTPRRRGRLGWTYTWRNEILIANTDMDLNDAGGSLAGNVSVAAGQRRYLCLAYTKGDPAIIPPLGSDADRRLAETIEWWREWSGRCRNDGPFDAEVVRSMVTLKLLSYAPSGAIVAAPTTSLPEAPGKGRNWDYRYCWLRDAGLTNQALVSLGYHDEARSFLGWLLHATRLTWPRLQVLYDVFGRTRLDEHELPHLAGHCNSPPVRIGNAAHRQRQLDVYGEVVTAAAAVAGAGKRFDAVDCRMLAGFGDVVCQQWREPDSSIWEIRGPPRHYTFSKVMCWAALDRLLKLHACGAITLAFRRLDRFRSERAAIEETIELRGFNAALGSYTGELDGDRVDASLLLMACIGYRNAGDARMRTTYDLIQRRLGHHGLLDRYERNVDGMEGAEGTFGICSFWAIDNLAKRGEVDEAERQLRHMLTFANDLGLYAEEIEAESGAPLGNFPQAFTHVGLINAAMALEAARQKGRA
jgi:GH15 family glucan-1,4-alpha-glucosidase